MLFLNKTIKIFWSPSVNVVHHAASGVSSVDIFIHCNFQFFSKKFILNILSLTKFSEIFANKRTPEFDSWPDFSYLELGLA